MKAAAKSEVVAEIKKLAESKNIIIGTERTIKNLKLGKIDKVFLSSNCPKEVRGDIEYYSKIAKIPVITLIYQNDELGILCKKPYTISVLSSLRV